MGLLEQKVEKMEWVMGDTPLSVLSTRAPAVLRKWDKDVMEKCH